MKSSFPKSNTCHSIKWASNANKYDLQTWHWLYKFNFWTGAYHVLEKSSS